MLSQGLGHFLHFWAKLVHTRLKNNGRANFLARRLSGRPRPLSGEAHGARTTAREVLRRQGPRAGVRSAPLRRWRWRDRSRGGFRLTPRSAETRLPGNLRAGRPDRRAAQTAFRVLSAARAANRASRLPRAPRRSLPDSREFQSRLPAPPAPPSAARALPAPPPAPAPPRAAAPANEVRGRVRRFKRRLLREARREIRRCGQNPAGGCECCRAARCGERAGVGARDGAAPGRQRRGGGGGGGRGGRRAGARLLTWWGHPWPGRAAARSSGSLVRPSVPDLTGPAFFCRPPEGRSGGSGGRVSEREHSPEAGGGWPASPPSPRLCGTWRMAKRSRRWVTFPRPGPSGPVWAPALCPFPLVPTQALSGLDMFLSAAPHPLRPRWPEHIHHDRRVRATVCGGP